MKNKFLKIICTFLLLFNYIYINADEIIPIVDVNYNTVYKNDILDMKIGFDHVYFEEIVEKKSIDINGEKSYEYKSGHKFNYKMKTFFIKYDNESFDFDFSNLEIPNSNYVLMNYYEKVEKYYTFVFFDFDLKEKFDKEVNRELIYDGIIDDILIENIKIKVKPETHYSTSFIETGFGTYDDYSDFEISRGEYPITVISNEKTENSISQIFINRPWLKGCNFETDFIDVEKDVYTYDAIFRNEFDDVEIYSFCNSKCKIKGIGNSWYVRYGFKSSENKKLSSYNIDIEYENSGKDIYTINNKYGLKTINQECIISREEACIAVIGHSNYKEGLEYYNKLKKYYENNSLKSNISYYQYDKLNEIDRKILDSFDYQMNASVAPNIYKVTENELTYRYNGFISEDRWNNFMKEFDSSYMEPLPEDNNDEYQDIKDIMDSSLKDRMDNLGVKYSLTKFEKFMLKNDSLIFCVLIVILVVLIILVIIVGIKNCKIKKVIKNKEKDSNKENDKSLNENQNKTLE